MAGESALFRLRERPPTPAVRAFELPPRMQPMLDRAKTDLAEPFRGIITDGGIVPGLFTIEKTGVSIVPLLEATRSFLVSLSAEQRKAACFAIDDEAWRQWSNIHPWLMRHGICLADLDGNQRETALALMREAMSTAGYQTARDVMRLNEHALEITGKPEEYGQWFYWFSIFGTPSPEQPWGWQIDGHHLNVNCFVLGDQLVLTPIFMGSEPILARFGKHQGTRVFVAEEEQGYVLMRALDRFRDALVIRADHLAQVLGTDPRGQGCRADEVAEHHCELTALRANGAGRPKPLLAERPSPLKSRGYRQTAWARRHLWAKRRRHSPVLEHPFQQPPLLGSGTALAKVARLAGPNSAGSPFDAAQP